MNDYRSSRRQVALGSVSIAEYRFARVSLSPFFKRYDRAGVPNLLLVRQVLLAIVALFAVPSRCQSVEQLNSKASNGTVSTSESVIDFDTQVVPLLTRLGCNAGACHGAAAGRGEFRLSLLGSNPAADHQSIVEAFEGRRVDRTQPDSSLLIKKPSGQLEHGGETLFPAESDSAQLLQRWIAQGCLRQSTSKLDALYVTLQPEAVRLVPSKVAIRVVARFEDGISRDVSNLAKITSEDPQAVQIHGDNSASIAMPGQHIVLVRYMNRVAALQWNIPHPVDANNVSETSASNFIDAHVVALLRQMHLSPADPASDLKWLRRVTIDLTGRLPTIEQVRRFEDDRDPEKRTTYVDRLLASSALSDYWTWRFSRWLRMHSLPQEPAGLNAYSQWLRECIASDTSWNRIATDLIESEGDSYTLGPANFARMVADPREHAELFGQFFLGQRLGCAKCHDHPLDVWTQDDYHGLAAIFARLDRGRFVKSLPYGNVTNLRTNEPAIPKLPGSYDATNSEEARAALAQWILKDDTRLFSRAMVNRIWSCLFGRGLVHPVDDMRQTNPATHPELFEDLSVEFVRGQYSLKHMLRTIALSDTYARSCQSNKEPMDEKFYAALPSRWLDAEILLDAISDVTEIHDQIGTHSPQSSNLSSTVRAVQLIDSVETTPSLDAFGRCRRMGACDSEEHSQSDNLRKQLHLFNGDVINARLKDTRGRLQQLLNSPVEPESIIDEFYVRSLTRHPTPDELAYWLNELNVSDLAERNRRWEDFVWTLLSSTAFRENR